MDFIPELPECEGYDNVLVIVNKFTKYAIFIPTTATITERETAKLIFQHVISQYGIPRQIISNRDTWWQADFWKDICDKMGMKRALTMVYHPQAESQMAIMNQTLEISLQTYVGPNRDNWVTSLNGLSFSYNSTQHTATGFTPAYLLRGYAPVTSSSLIHSPENVSKYSDASYSLTENDLLCPDVSEMMEQFNAERQQAQEALLFGQYFQI